MVSSTGVHTVIQEALLPGEKSYFKNVYIDIEGVLHATPVNMPKDGLWRFDGQFFYQTRPKNDA